MQEYDYFLFYLMKAFMSTYCVRCVPPGNKTNVFQKIANVLVMANKSSHAYFYSMLELSYVFAVTPSMSSNYIHLIQISEIWKEIRRRWHEVWLLYDAHFMLCVFFFVPIFYRSTCGCGSAWNFALIAVSPQVPPVQSIHTNKSSSGQGERPPFVCVLSRHATCTGTISYGSFWHYGQTGASPQQ